MIRYMKAKFLSKCIRVAFICSGVLLAVSAEAAPFGVGSSGHGSSEGQALSRQFGVARSSLQMSSSTLAKGAHANTARGQKAEPKSTDRLPAAKGDGQKKGGAVHGHANTVVRGASIRDQAFSNASRMLMPMTPNQIQTLHQLYSKSQRAIASSPSTPPKPTTTELALNIAPGSTPPVIRLAAGFVTSVALLDATSSPWPIEWIDVGNPKDYNVQWDKKSNVMIIQALTSYGSANLALKLVDMPTPIMITLMPGQKVVDYRVDLRVPGIGPNGASASSVQGLPNMGDPVILSVLNGVPPRGSVTLEVKGGAAKAWLIHNQVYLRTRMTVISPSWITQLSSGDGTHVYVLPVSPIVLAMDHGRMTSLTVKYDG